ncbi:ThiF family adenylyltransferase [Actinomycetospora aeridis]|uniref:ThiF family adenylyltransferase n=1 Tax=Actinomycetospora aeridis TaxID=3129231 RepID=A0ABU8MZQ3_9PSEU
MTGVTRSGHTLAAEQLAALEAVSHGRIEFVDDRGPDGGLVVSLDTSTVPRGPGITVRARERFRLLVPVTFPFDPPHVFVTHRRWAKTPHVQWGRLLCLYASTSVEWTPADGIRGLVERLSLWLERAAADDLDPDDQPLHPPVTYTDRSAGIVVVRADLADRVPWFTAATATAPATVTATAAADTVSASPATATLFAWCRRDDQRLDVLGWCTLAEVVGQVLEDDQTGCDEHGRPYVVVATVLVDDRIGWEFPEHARDLADALDGCGYRRDQLIDAITAATRINRYLRTLDPSPAQGTPAAAHETTPRPTTTGESSVGGPAIDDQVRVLLATPARRVDTARLAHIVAWRFDDLGTDITTLLADFGEQHSTGTPDLDDEHAELNKRVRALVHDWLGFAGIRWSRVYELRDEVTRRRDARSVLSWMRSKRVLLLGVGALGAPVADQVVRAGVSEVLIVDSGRVTPGILVRQPFVDADIGTPKAQALAARLNRIDASAVARALVADVPAALQRGDIDPSAFDLIIDATADVATRAALERRHTSERGRWPALVTMVIGHEARRGVVTVSLPGATRAGQDLLRRVALAGRGEHQAAWGDIAADLFPTKVRDRFSPEPGCSAPTFVGSASEVTALGAQLLTRAAVVLDAAVHPEPTADGDPAPVPPPPMTAIAVRLLPDHPGHLAGRDTPTSTLSWYNDLCTREERFGYELRVAPAALAEMRTETRRGRRVRGPMVETGGMLLGTLDEATGVITIDLATGPSPDSLLSAAFFDHGVEGTQEIVAHHRTRSGDLIGFAGLWHTHPEGPARPSAVDERAIATLTRLGRRAIMLILAGSGPVWEQWCDGTGTPELYARMEHTTAPPRTSRSAVDAAQLGALAGAAVFPGGFADSAPGRGSGSDAYVASALAGSPGRVWRRIKSRFRFGRSRQP